MADDYSYGYYPYGYQSNYNPYGFGTQNPYTAWGLSQNQMGTQAGSDPGSIYFPTPTEATQWAAGIPGFQQQANILGGMSTPEGFQQTLQPYINQMMTSLGRSGLPSSSYADRMISDTLGNVYAQNALNLASGWNNYMGGLGEFAGGYAQYPMYVAGLLQG
jgi:hypothetical protein